MKVVVPTFQVACLLRETITVGPAVHTKGTVVKMAYGVALQGMARGVVGAIVNADAAHDEAMAYIAKYGADSWFPSKLQTIGMVMAAANAADDEAQQPAPVRH